MCAQGASLPSLARHHQGEGRDKRGGAGQHFAHLLGSRSGRRAAHVPGVTIHQGASAMTA